MKALSLDTAHESRRLIWIVLALVTFVTCWLQPDFAEVHNPNALVRIYLTRALVDEGTVRIDGPLRRWGDLGDKAVREGHFYCDKAPGVSLLALPIYGALRLGTEAKDLSNRRLIQISRLVLCGLALPAILWMLELWLAGLGVTPPRRAAVLATLGSGSMLFPYSLDLFGHVPAALFVTAVAYFSLGRGAGRRDMFVAGLATGLAVLTEYPALVVAAPLLVGGLVARGDRLRRALSVALGGAAPALIFFTYNDRAFGHPLKTGYAFIANPFFHKVHEQGFMGISHPTLASVVGSLLSPARGIFFIAPWTALALVSIAFLWRRHRRLALSMGASISCAVLLVTSFGYWVGGWSVGQRHLTVIMPLLALCLGLGWQTVADHFDQAWARLLRAAIIVTSGVSLIMVSATSLTLAAFPREFSNPVVEQTATLWRWGLFPYTLASALGVPSRLGIVPAVLATLLLLLVVLMAARGERPAGHGRRLGLMLGAWMGLWIGLLPLAGESDAAAQHTREWLIDTVWEPRDALPAKQRDPVKVLRAWSPLTRTTPTLLRHLARQAATQDDPTQALELLSQARLLEMRAQETGSP